MMAPNLVCSIILFPACRRYANLLSMKQTYRIGIVGFGIAGGLSAYLLSKAGHDVTLMEQTETLGPSGAGVLLQPSGQMVLS